jgi:hypothetical protein
MSSTGAKRRKIDCGSLNCGGDANFGNNVTIANNLTVDGTIEGTAIVPDIKGIADGSAASPSIAFANSANTGIYRDTSTPGLAITANGTEKFRVGNSATYSLQDFHADGYTVWAGDVEASLGTGSFSDVQSGTAEVSIVTIGSSGKIILPNGSAAGPIVNFSSSPSTGLYSPSSNTLGVSCNGSQILSVSPSAVQSNQPFTCTGNINAGTFTGYPNSGSTALVQQYYALSGSTALIPAYTFQGDNETGIFQPSTGEVSLCTSGTEQLRVGPSSIQTFLPLVTNETVTTTNGLTSGNFTGSMPVQSPHWKIVVIAFNNYVNHTATAQSYTFPIPFTQNPIGQFNVTLGLNSTTTTTSLSFNPNSATVFNGVVYITGL